MKKKNQKAKNAGLDVSPPKDKCEDKNCPFHGQAVLRGRTFTGLVIGGDTHGTVRVEWSRSFYIPKYERYEKRKSRIKAHNPPCINAQKGDHVKLMESRPISKTKSFIIVEKIK